MGTEESRMKNEEHKEASEMVRAIDGSKTTSAVKNEGNRTSDKSQVKEH